MQDSMLPLGAEAQVVRSYGASGFRIAQGEYDSHVLVLPSRTLVWSGALTVEALAPLLPSPSEAHGEDAPLLLIGTGARHEMIAPELRRALKAHGLAVDSMDTGAACRTFNILLGEGRRVAAALRLAV